MKTIASQFSFVVKTCVPWSGACNICIQTYCTWYPFTGARPARGEVQPAAAATTTTVPAAELDRQPAAGAIPYYSRLPTLDMHGLSDPWIAREGVVVSARPGHQRQPPLEYLLERGVHLVIGHPRLEPAGSERELRRSDLGRFRIANFEPTELPPGARLVELPVGESQSLTALYLTPSEAVDARIRELDLVTYAPWAGEARRGRR